MAQEIYYKGGAAADGKQPVVESTKTIEDIKSIASQAQAEAGSDDNTIMTPLKVAQHKAANPDSASDVNNDSDVDGDKVSDALNNLKTDVDSALELVDSNEFLVDTFVELAIGAWVNAASVPVGEAQSIAPFTSGTGWAEKTVDISIVSGALPDGLSLVTDPLDADWSKIVGTAGSTGSGSCVIRCSNPKGDYDYTLNWTVLQPNGILEFTNDESLYPTVRVTTSNSVDTQLLIRQDFYGTVNGSGTITEDSSKPIWVANNGDGTWNYLIDREGSSYWYYYAYRTTDPSTLADGLSTDLTSSGFYDLVAANSNDFMVDGVNYPSDQSDTHYGTTEASITFGNDASFDGFMSDNNTWSYGFKLTRAIPADSLGRVMFARDGRNWLGFYIGQNGTYTNLLIGNGSSKNYTGETTYPSGGFAAGSYVRVTFAGGTVKIFVNGTEYFSYSSASVYWDSASSSDSLDVVFGKGAESNDYQFNTSYFHGYWQGQIERLWIANGVEVSTDDDGTTFPVGTTHSWLLDEVIGSTFTANTGGVNGTGQKDA